MKSTYIGKRDLFRCTRNSRCLGYLKERVETIMTFSAVVVATLAMYAVMSVALYRWSSYAPIFPPDTGSAITDVSPWSQ